MRAIIAYTTNPNTPETDAMRQVMHTVELDNGEKRQVMAEAPDDAIAKVNRELGA